jgi:hypothetical protein
MVSQSDQKLCNVRESGFERLTIDDTHDNCIFLQCVYNLNRDTS